MESLVNTIRAIITISDKELEYFLSHCLEKRFKKK